MAKVKNKKLDKYDKACIRLLNAIKYLAIILSILNLVLPFREGRRGFMSIGNLIMIYYYAYSNLGCKGLVPEYTIPAAWAVGIRFIQFVYSFAPWSNKLVYTSYFIIVILDILYFALHFYCKAVYEIEVVKYGRKLK